MRETIINIILSIPGLGTIEHVQRSGIDMDDIDMAADKILTLFDESYEKGYNDATKEACHEIAKNYHPNDQLFRRLL